MCSELSGVEALFEKAARNSMAGIALIADKNNVYGLGIALEKEEVYYIPAEELLSGEYLCEKLRKDVYKRQIRN